MDPTQAQQMIGLLGCLLAITALVGLKPPACDDPSCQPVHAAHIDREKRKAATSRHPQHGAGFREALCAKCNEPKA